METQTVSNFAICNHKNHIFCLDPSRHHLSDLTWRDIPQRHHQRSPGHLITLTMRCSRTMGLVDRVLSAKFRRLGEHIGRKPGFFLVMPVMISLLAATGVQQLRYQDDPEYLFSPSNGRSREELAVVERLFPTNFTAFNTGRMTDTGHFIRLIVTAPGGGSVLKQDIFDELVKLDKIVREVEVDAGEEQWAYDQICASWGDECLDNVPMKMQKYMADVEANRTMVAYPVWITEDDVIVTIEALGSPVLGGVYGEDVIEAPALQMVYWVGNHEYFNVSL